ncbi:glycosyltransferase family 9 protein [Winslowiella iniecta]|uniref:Glycosyl transferase n=1 Tax=Winslowiella iniecta TaxID=1560201 RepID=A0A0L7T0T4_9GAMM|nr:glycosyltransferase family 9 protein [Winslowiella iniecta]KOC89002.1 glycosyl transferase [Winslowiella iniecta]KOC92649.1 glycosyl transferase [Winslowiella iniecta]
MKILLIRRDNIGDLILTTPLIATLATSLNCKVDVLVNTYNQPILEHNPHVGKVHIYSKLHHRHAGQSAAGVIFRRCKTMIDIRRAGYDVAIIAREQWDKRPLQWARLSGAKRIIAIGENAPPAITDCIPPTQQRNHIVELLNQFAQTLGINQQPGALELYVTEQELTKAAQQLSLPDGVPRYGLQISARKPMQRWQADKFIELAHRLARQENCHFLLFWSPGSADNQQHPGDDEKAQYIIDRCQDIALTPVVTHTLRELMAAVSLCDQMLTSDGGALHIAAGLGKPVVALFGNSDAWFWGPWQVPNKVLSAESRNVGDISVDTVEQQFVQLRESVLKGGA